MIRTSFTASAACALLGCSSLSFSQTLQPVNLDEQVVTATRTERSFSRIASSTVFTREEIERSQASSALDLLRGLAGVSVSANGGRGKTSSVYIRGTSSQHLLVLVDGIKIGSATSGGASLESIPVEQIERIELVRGPRSSLYGSEAVGGVMQIFTRQGDGDGSGLISRSGLVVVPVSTAPQVFPAGRALAGSISASPANPLMASIPARIAARRLGRTRRMLTAIVSSLAR